MSAKQALASILVSSALAQGAGTQVPEASRSQSSAPHIAITIASEHSSYRAGEPIAIAIDTKNISYEDYCEVHIRETNHAERNDYRPIVQRGGLVLPALQRAMTKKTFSLVRFCLKPGKSTTTRLHSDQLLVNELVDMKTPGTYVIRIDHRDRMLNSRVESNALAIEVTS